MPGELAEGVIRGGAWLYLSVIIVNASGFGYWLVMLHLIPRQDVGAAAAALGYGTLVAGLTGLGVDQGLLPYLGRATGRAAAATYTAALAVRIAAAAGGSAALAAAAAAGLLPGVTAGLAAAAGVIAVSTAAYGPAWSLASARLETGRVLAYSTAASAAKLALGPGLALAGAPGWAAAAAGLAAFSAVNAALGLGYAASRGYLARPALAGLGGVVRAGLAAWAPWVLGVAGQWAGVVAVYSYAGGGETGVYYIAFAIANVALSVPLSLSQVLVPAVARGDSSAAGPALRLSTAIAAPAAVALALWPHGVLGLLGRGYEAGARALAALAPAVALTPLYMMVYSVAYGRGRYGEALLLGLAANAPRLALYPQLAGSHGDLGAALAYTAGAAAGYAAASLAAGRYGVAPGHYRLARAVAACSAPALAAWALGAPWPLGYAAALAPTLLYRALGVLEEEDVRALRSLASHAARAIRIYT